jgi:hypothetical protein
VKNVAGSLEKENKRGEKQKAIDKLTAELEKVGKDSMLLKNLLNLLAFLATCLTFKVCCTYLLYFEGQRKTRVTQRRVCKNEPNLLLQPWRHAYSGEYRKLFFFRASFLFFVRYPQAAAQLACVTGSYPSVSQTRTHTQKMHRHVLLRSAET